MNNINRLNQLAAFFIIAYIISWLCWLPYYVGCLPARAADMPLFHFVGSLGPMAAAIICSFMFGGAKGIVAFACQVCSLRGLAYIIIALAAPFVILAVSVMVNGSFSAFDWGAIWYNKELETHSPAVWALVNIGIYGLGEEVGWRGYALPRIQSRFNALSSAVILSFFWALWHWPLFFYRHSGYYTMDVTAAIGWFFSIITGSIILSWLFNSSRGSTLACVVFHGAMEVAFTTGHNAAAIAQVSGITVTIIGIMIVVFGRPENLSGKRRVIA